MRYPTVSLQAVRRVAADRIQAGATQPMNLTDDFDVRWTGDGADVELAPLMQLPDQLDVVKDESAANKLDEDQTEGRAAGVLCRALATAGADVSVLDDAGFWRYVGLACTWRFTIWREHKAIAGALGNPDRRVPDRFWVYVNGRSATECVPLRMYLRVQSLGGLQYADLASAVRAGTDFWRSHILRVKAGEHPAIVRGMVRRQSDEATRLSTSELRELAKSVTRTLTNLVPGLLSDEDADALVGELWQRWETP